MSTTTTVPIQVAEEHKVDQADPQTHKTPLKLSGILDQFKSFDVTPVIGREYHDVNLKEWLEASNSDELLRDLAITSESAS